MQEPKAKKGRWYRLKNGVMMGVSDMKHHYTLWRKKYLYRKTKPKSEFYEKRGR
jgi:hypothetical protein